MLKIIILIPGSALILAAQLPLSGPIAGNAILTAGVANIVTTYGATCNGTGTGDAAAFNAAYVAGGLVFVPATASCVITSTVVKRSNTTVWCANPSATITLAAGVNAALFQGLNFASLTGTNSNLGIHDSNIIGCTLDANKANNTTSYAVQEYGYRNFYQFNVFRNANGPCFYSEWGSGSAATQDAMEGHFISNQFHDCVPGATTGDVEFKGPHDSVWTDNIIYNQSGSATGYGFHSGANGSVLVTGMHVWGRHTQGLYSEVTAHFKNMYLEGHTVQGAMMGANDSTFEGIINLPATAGLVALGVGDGTHTGVHGLRLSYTQNGHTGGSIDFTNSAPDGGHDITIVSDAGSLPFVGTQPGDTALKISGTDGTTALPCQQPSETCFDEEFTPTSVSNGLIGTLGWEGRTIGAAPTISYKNGAPPNLGIVNMATTTTSGQGGSLALDAISSAAIMGNMAQYFWYSDLIFRLNTTVTVQYRIGYYTGGTTAAIPANGHYLRYDTTLQAVTSAVCNDAGNKCGLTTISGCTGQTVTFSINGGTATGSVACTGAGAISNGSAITVVSAGKGYNATGGAAVGTVTGSGTATVTGSIALTTTLSGAATGSDTDFMYCEDLASVETCYDTTVAPDGATFVRLHMRRVATGGIFAFSMWNGQTGAQLLSEKTSCTAAAASCNLVLPAQPAGNSMTVGADLVTAANSAANVDVDAWHFRATGLTR